MRHLRILIADDDPAILKFLKSNLEARGCKTLIAMNGAEVINIAEKELLDLIILDITMPKIDGFEVCERLREWSQIPIIMLSASDDLRDKVRCLNLGADDYITKPFGVSELIARVKAVIRRTKATIPEVTSPSFTSDNLDINFVQRRVTVGSKEVKLTPTEYSLLQEFVLNAGKVLTHAYLLNRVWGPEYGQEREYLRVFVQRLRSKLESDPANPKHITTVSSVGYQFKDTE